jgi:thiol-disulfide isomerase/thioredoxin
MTSLPAPVATLAALVALTLAGCTSDDGDPLPLLGPAPDVTGATAWLGTDPLTLEDLRGSVVLVDFWTYSCINCIRTLPYVTGWYDTYRDHGFVVLGIHAPEFEFEEDAANVLDAMDRFAIDYPVAQDNDFRVWRAYDNHVWPAKYLIDAEGRLRYDHFGEGAYDVTEDHIRSLLAEAGRTDLPSAWGDGSDGGRRGTDITRELYAGTYRQADALGNDEGYRPGQTVTYDAPNDPAGHQRDRIYLDGLWFNGEEALRADSAATLWLTFRAGAANFVADGPPGSCIPVRLDGVPIHASLAGADVETDRSPPCIALSTTPRSYDFFSGEVAAHTVRFDVPIGFSLYTFAFSAYDHGGNPP